MSVLGFPVSVSRARIWRKCYIVVEENFVNVLAISVDSTWLRRVAKKRNKVREGSRDWYFLKEGFVLSANCGC
jgi:hypothetical protein